MTDGLGRHELEDGADGAERAFEALQAEVAGVGQRVDALARQIEQGGGAITPDYSPTLGAMAKELKAVSARLDGIEQHPALRMTPASYRAEIEAVARSTASVASRPYADSLRDAQAAARQLEALAGRVRDRREQRWSLITVGGFGVVGGVLLWLLLVELLPWGAGHWLATLPLGGGRWNAGATLLYEAEPTTWDRMARLYKACPSDSTTELCEAAMAVRTIPPGQPLSGPERTKGAAPPASPTPRNRIAR